MLLLNPVDSVSTEKKVHESMKTKYVTAKDNKWSSPSKRKTSIDPTPIGIPGADRTWHRALTV